MVGGIALLEEHTVVGVSDQSFGGAPHELGVLSAQRDEGDGQRGFVKLADLFWVRVLGG